MYNAYEAYNCHYCMNAPRYTPDIMYNAYNAHPCPYYGNTPLYNSDPSNQFANQYIPFPNQMRYDSAFDSWQLLKDHGLLQLQDYGPEPFVVNIEEATKQNNTFRTALWTGSHFQVTLMSIAVGEDIGLELHTDTDQFIRIEEGQGLVQMGDSKYNLDFQREVFDDFAFVIPAGKWHNLINTGDKPLKVYSIYAPPQHPFGTVHGTKAAAQAAEEEHQQGD